MANPEHVALVKQGAEAIRQWRQKNPEVRLDLREAHLAQADMRDMQLTEADLEDANLQNADLTAANVYGADLQRADLREATLYRARLHTANLANANLGGANLENADLRETNLNRANLAGANLAEANLENADLRETNLNRANLAGAKLADANLSRADFAQANVREANLARANLHELRGAYQVRGLETVQCREGPSQYFETCERRWPEQFLDWERLRVVGRLPLFGVSYTALILIPIFFYGLALYNRNIDLVHAWAKEAITSSDHPLHPLAPPILEHLHRLSIPHLSFILFVSTFLLAVGSTLYTFFCPSRVKEFSRDQWCDQLRHPLLHYWPLAWKHRSIRITCAACYALGGIGASYVLVWKLCETGVFIWMNTTWPWS